MTQVVVQDLAGDARLTLRCHALVRKVAVYARRLAILLPGSLLVYSLPDRPATLSSAGPPSGMAQNPTNGLARVGGMMDPDPAQPGGGLWRGGMHRSSAGGSGGGLGGGSWGHPGGDRADHAGAWAVLAGGRSSHPPGNRRPSTGHTGGGGTPGGGCEPWGGRDRAGAAGGRGAEGRRSDGECMQYSLAARIDRRLECNLLVATDCHLVLCQACPPSGGGPPSGGF